MSAKRMVLINIIVILVIVIAGFTGYYFYNQSTLYLKTNNAQITGQQIVISAPATGKLTSWQGDVGGQLQAGSTVGTVTVDAPPGKGTVSVPVTIPTDGTVVQNNAVQNELVAPGVPLAYAYDLGNLWVNANIKETSINDVKVGQSVDVYVDADPGVTFKGTVASIGLTTASTFSMLPSTTTTADYTKVTQVIPVKITLQSSQGNGFVPGMSATIRIHK